MPSWQNFEDEVIARFDSVYAQLQTVMTNQQTLLANLQDLRATQQASLTILQAMQSVQQTILTKEINMSAEMDALTAAITKIEGAGDSTVKLITDLSAYIKANANNPAAIQAYADELSAKADAMAAAVEANPAPA